MARSSTTFVKGQSGNPHGRPKADFDLRDFARGFGKPAIVSLAQLAGLGDGPPAANEAVRVAALRELLDRGFGKATLPISGDADAPPLAVDFRWADAVPQQQPEPELLNDPGDAEEETSALWSTC